jgi:hypothetical protein
MFKILMLNLYLTRLVETSFKIAEAVYETKIKFVEMVKISKTSKRQNVKVLKKRSNYN